MRKFFEYVLRFSDFLFLISYSDFPEFFSEQSAYFNAAFKPSVVV